MDIVLGVSMAPTAVRMVLLEGENADGVTIEEDTFEVTAHSGSATSFASEQVIAAILGTREGAAEGGYRLMSTGVTWTEPGEVAALREALAIREIRNVMLVSPLLAAAALAQTVGHAVGYECTALLFVEPYSATLAVVETGDGSIVDLHRRQLQPVSDGAVAELAAMVSTLDRLESPPGGVFLVGCGVDIAPIKPQLDAAVSLPVSAAEEPDMALARGAALASANAPLFASSTAALAYAQDPGTGEVNPAALSPTYLDLCANADVASGALAYSALGDDDDEMPPRRRGLLVGSAVAAIVVIGFVALVISLAADVGPPVPHQAGPQVTVAPAIHAPAAKHAPPAKPAPPAAAPAPPPPSAVPAPPPSAAPAPPPPPKTITAPTPVVQQKPQRAVTPAPAPVHKPVQHKPVYVPPKKAAPPPPPAAPPPPPPAAPPPPPPPRLPPMVMYLHLPFVTVPIPINPPPPPPPPP